MDLRVGFIVDRWSTDPVSSPIPLTRDQADREISYGSDHSLGVHVIHACPGNLCVPQNDFFALRTYYLAIHVHNAKYREFRAVYIYIMLLRLKSVKTTEDQGWHIVKEFS